MQPSRKRPHVPFTTTPDNSGVGAESNNVTTERTLNRPQHMNTSQDHSEARWHDQLPAHTGENSWQQNPQRMESGFPSISRKALSQLLV